VESGAVIKGFDVVEDGIASLREGGEALVVDHFIFEAAPEGFDKGVVVAVAFPAHGSDQAMLSEELAISGAGKLRAAIGVDDEGPGGPALKQRHPQSGTDEASVEDLMHGPADDAASVAVQDGDEVKPALGGQDASGIGHPDMIGTADGKVLEAIRRDRAAMSAIGRPRPVLGALPGEEPLLTHESSDAIAPAGATQSLRQPRTAIGLATADKLLPNALA
jgi:hypothetical protein